MARCRPASRLSTRRRARPLPQTRRHRGGRVLPGWGGAAVAAAGRRCGQVIKSPLRSWPPPPPSDRRGCGRLGPVSRCAWTCHAIGGRAPPTPRDEARTAQPALGTPVPPSALPGSPAAAHHLFRGMVIELGHGAAQRPPSATSGGGPITPPHGRAGGPEMGGRTPWGSPPKGPGKQEPAVTPCPARRAWTWGADQRAGARRRQEHRRNRDSRELTHPTPWRAPTHTHMRAVPAVSTGRARRPRRRLRLVQHGRALGDVALRLRARRHMRHTLPLEDARYSTRADFHLEPGLADHGSWEVLGATTEDLLALTPPSEPPTTRS